jgi:hypothetical protein
MLSISQQASLDDVIKTCENLHVEEQFNMEPISLQLMDTNCKPIHAHAYTVPRSVEQQLQHSKEIVRLVEIGVLEEDYSSEWASMCPTFAMTKKHSKIRVVTDFRNNRTQLIVET